MDCAIFPLRIVGDFIFTASCFAVQGTLHSVQFLKYYLPVTQQSFPTKALHFHAGSSRQWIYSQVFGMIEKFRYC